MALFGVAELIPPPPPDAGPRTRLRIFTLHLTKRAAVAQWNKLCWACRFKPQHLQLRQLVRRRWERPPLETMESSSQSEKAILRSQWMDGLIEYKEASCEFRFSLVCVLKSLLPPLKIYQISGVLPVNFKFHFRLSPVTQPVGIESTPGTFFTIYEICFLSPNIPRMFCWRNPLPSPNLLWISH